MANAITTNTPAAIAITDILTIKNLETGKMAAMSYKQAPDESDKDAIENFKFEARNSIAFEYAIMRGDTVLYSTVKAAKVPATEAAPAKAAKVPATEAAPTEPVSWPEMRNAARAYLDLSVGGAVAAATDKGAAILLVSRAIVGAILEYGFSGNDSRIEAARKELAPVKGAGQKLRALALKALEFRVDTTKKGLEGDRVKPRSLKILGQAGMLEWCDLTASAISAEIAPVARETSAVVAETSPATGEVSPSIVAEASPLDPLDPIDDIMARTHGLDIEALIELQARITSLIESLSEVTSA